MGKGKRKTKRGMVGPQQPRNSWAICRKSRIYDCYGILENVAWIWRLMGIFPFTITETMGKKQYGINKFYAFYSVLIFVTCFANLFYGIMDFGHFLRSEDVARAYCSIVTRTFGSIMCMIISIIFRVYRNKELPELIKTMAALEVFLEKMGCRLHYEGKIKTFRLYLWMSTTTTVILMTYDYTSSTGSPESFFITLRWLVWVIPLVAQILNLTIFVFLVGLLGLKFRALNEKIKTVVIRVNASSPKVIVTSDVCGESLRLVAKAHYKMCELGKRINSFFKWDVIINVIAAFIILISTLHGTYSEFQRKTHVNYRRIGSYVHWEFFHIIPIIVIVVICNWTSKQCIYAGKLIHEIRVEKTDARLYEAMRTFSLQLHHQKLEFTAGGFFPLNSTLLQSMVANISTYLVILIQFQPKEKQN